MQFFNQGPSLIPQKSIAKKLKFQKRLTAFVLLFSWLLCLNVNGMEAESSNKEEIRRAGFQAANEETTDQEEEGWRWKDSLDIYLQNTLHGYCINNQKIHEELNEIEKKFVFEHLNHNSIDANIGIAAITVIIKNLSYYFKKTEPVANNLGNAGPPYYPLIFSSTQEISINSPFTAKLDIPGNMVNLWYSSSKITGNALTKHLNKLLDKQVTYNPMSFNHSEQKAIFYLWNMARNKSLATSNLIQQVKKMLPDGINKNNVVGIIVHIHSTRDPCENCRASLGKFSKKVKAALKTWTDTKGSSKSVVDQKENSNNPKELKENNLFPNVQFYCTVSSRISYGNSRYKTGHSINIKKPIVMALGSLPRNGVNCEGWEELKNTTQGMNYSPGSEYDKVHWFATTFPDAPEKPVCFKDLKP